MPGEVAAAAARGSGPRPRSWTRTRTGWPARTHRSRGRRRPRCTRHRLGPCPPRGSTVVDRSPAKSITRASSQTPNPAPWWPPPRTASGIWWSRAKFTQAITSATSATRTTAARVSVDRAVVDLPRARRTPRRSGSTIRPRTSPRSPSTSMPRSVSMAVMFFSFCGDPALCEDSTLTLGSARRGSERPTDRTSCPFVRVGRPILAVRPVALPESPEVMPWMSCPTFCSPCA